MDRHSIFIDWKTQYHFSLNTSISPNWDWGPFQSKSQKDVENLILKYTGECRETRIANMVSKKNKIGGSTAPHSSTLAWKIPWTREPGRLQSMGSLRVGHDWATSLSLSCIGEGNGTPLQCSCLKNPRDGGAWWAAIYGVTQSRTRLKWLSSSNAFVW